MTTTNKSKDDIKLLNQLKNETAERLDRQADETNQKLNLMTEMVNRTNE